MEYSKPTSLLKVVFEFVAVVACFGLIGIGLGFLQGILAFRQLGTDVVIGYASFASIIGAIVALFVGLFCYIFLGHERTIIALPEVVLVSAIVGIGSGYVLGMTQVGWLSMFMTPLAAVVAAIRIAIRPSNALQHEVAPVGPISRGKVAFWLAIVLLCGLLLYLFSHAASRANMPNDLLIAAEQGDLNTVRELLDKGVDIKSTDGWSGTPMMYAAGNGHTAVVELLLSRGADLNEHSRMSRTPLMWAAQRGQDATVRFLLQRGAKLDLRDREEKTALMLAEEEGKTNTATLLKAAGELE